MVILVKGLVETSLTPTSVTILVETLFNLFPVIFVTPKLHSYDFTRERVPPPSTSNSASS